MSNLKNKSSKKGCFGVLLLLLAGGGILLIIFSVLDYPIDNFIIPLSLCGLVPGVVTIVFSAPLLIPDWRRGMQTNPYIRMITVSIVSLAAFLILYVALTWLLASSIQVFGDPNVGIAHNFGPSTSDEELFHEIWKRQVFPLQSCYSSQPDICHMADERIQNVEANPLIYNSLFIMGLSFLYALLITFILLFFSRPKKPSPI